MAYTKKRDFCEMIRSTSVEEDDSDSLERIRYLLCCGVDPNTVYLGQTALMHACECGLENVAKMLIKNGAVIDATDRYGRTALHFAARFGHENVCSMLVSAAIDYGQNLEKMCRNVGRKIEDSTNEEGFLPLSTYASSFISAKAELLGGESAAEVARQCGFVNISHMLSRALIDMQRRLSAVAGDNYSSSKVDGKVGSSYISSSVNPLAIVDTGDGVVTVSSANFGNNQSIEKGYKINRLKQKYYPYQIDNEAYGDAGNGNITSHQKMQQVLLLQDKVKGSYDISEIPDQLELFGRGKNDGDPRFNTVYGGNSIAAGGKGGVKGGNLITVSDGVDVNKELINTSQNLYVYDNDRLNKVVVGATAKGTYTPGVDAIPPPYRQQIQASSNSRFDSSGAPLPLPPPFAAIPQPIVDDNRRYACSPKYEM